MGQVAVEDQEGTPVNIINRSAIDTTVEGKILSAQKRKRKISPCLSESIVLTKRIRYSDHLQLRLGLRRIPRHLPRSVYQRAKEIFYDNRTGNLVAVGRARYGGRLREMMVAYSEGKGEVTLVTVHPLKPRQKANRIASGRWIPYEKEKK